MCVTLLVCRCWCLHSLQVPSPEAFSDDAKKKDDENKQGEHRGPKLPDTGTIDLTIGSLTLPDTEVPSYEMTLPRHRHRHH